MKLVLASIGLLALAHNANIGTGMASIVAPTSDQVRGRSPLLYRAEPVESEPKFPSEAPVEPPKEPIQSSESPKEPVKPSESPKEPVKPSESPKEPVKPSEPPKEPAEPSKPAEAPVNPAVPQSVPEVSSQVSNTPPQEFGVDDGSVVDQVNVSNPIVVPQTQQAEPAEEIGKSQAPVFAPTNAPAPQGSGGDFTNNLPSFPLAPASSTPPSVTTGNLPVPTLIITFSVAGSPAPAPTENSDVQEAPENSSAPADEASADASSGSSRYTLTETSVKKHSTQSKYKVTRTKTAETAERTGEDDSAGASLPGPVSLTLVSGLVVGVMHWLA
ncbi:hypothetical protein IWQ61_002810 [Dispira simplex]|nr:hypothetical protein IWQ61_002810 [Dispira simplex]